MISPVVIPPLIEFCYSEPEPPKAPVPSNIHPGNDRKRTLIENVILVVLGEGSQVLLSFREIRTRYRGNNGGKRTHSPGI